MYVEYHIPAVAELISGDDELLTGTVIRHIQHQKVYISSESGKEIEKVKPIEVFTTLVF